MTSNMRIWDALSKTDPKHTKPFKRSGGFSGTATKPIWLTMRLTEHFGPAGTGWGMEKPEFQTVPGVEGVLVFCTVALWYEEKSSLDGGVGRATVYGVGGDKVVGKNKYGPFDNDEAFKAAYTDALSNAMKQIGVAADIHMGLFDDSKYRDEVAREFANGEHGPEPKALQGVAHEDRGLVNGDGRSAYQIKTADKSPGRLAAELWASQAVNLFKSPGFDLLGFREWKEEPCTPKGTKTNGEKLAELREKHPDLGDEIDKVTDELRVAVV